MFQVNLLTSIRRLSTDSPNKFYSHSPLGVYRNRRCFGNFAQGKEERACMMCLLSFYQILFIIIFLRTQKLLLIGTACV